ncbi:MAG: hypothetical protein HY267_03060 [Deltaproteobacteria bacterium]|nr:hypothetical protein [Deltaproteobacteria bacterium]
MAESAHGENFTSCFGRGGFGAQAFPGRFTGVAEVRIQECPVILAIHGNLYNAHEFPTTEKNGHNPVAAGILQWYLKSGIGVFQRLRGDFAIAIWDGREDQLYLAVDRFRIQPLFYSYNGEKLVFASRLRGLLAGPLAPQVSIELESIVDVAANSVIPTPKTIFREVRKLPAGYLLSYRAGACTLSPYWDIDFRHPAQAGEAELVRDLKAHMTDAVALCLAQDGAIDRVGTFLSGGIDSSTVTGVLTQLGHKPVKSFTIGFVEPRFNELSYAQIAARAFASEHHTYAVTPQDTYAAIPTLLTAFDEPFANASAIPTYFCAKLAKEQGITAIYAGDGGDELFAGNDRYVSQRVFEYYRMIPSWLRDPLLNPVVTRLAEWAPWNIFLKGKKYIQRAMTPYPQRISSYGLLSLIPLPELITENLLTQLPERYDPDAPISDYYYRASARTNLDRHMYLDLKLAISDNDLFKVVRMTEAAGITVRFPFLDHRLAEFAASVPTHIRMRGTRLRSFFKDAYADLLPAETRKKQKHGFGLPIPIWLRTDKNLNEMMHDLLLSSRSLQRGYFRKSALEELVARHQIDESSFYGTILWNLMILELWHRRYADAPLGRD